MNEGDRINRGNQENRPNQIRRKSPFWSLAGPLLGFLAIQGGVQMLLQLVIEIPYAMNGYMDAVQGGTQLTFQELMESYMQSMQPALEAVARHQVEIAAAASLCTIILTGILFARDRRMEKACGVFVPEKASFRKYWTVFVFGIAGCIGATCLMAMIQLAFYDDQYQQSAQMMYSASIPVQIIGLGIVIPVAEELMFRGVLYKRFRERQGFWYSALCSAILFAFMHSNATQMMYSFLLGVFLCYIYEKFGSFKAPVSLHIILNTGSVAFTELGVFAWIGADPMRMAGAVILGAFVCSVMFVLIQRMDGQINPGNTGADQNRTDMFR